MLDYKNQRCPSTWKPYVTKKGCGRINGLGCDSVIVPTGREAIRQICGRVRAFQWGDTDAFAAFAAPKPVTIDGPYVDGISITYYDEGKRQHVFTYAAGHMERSPTPLVTWNSITPIIILAVLALVPEELSRLCSLEAPTTTASPEIRITTGILTSCSATLCGTVKNADITRSPVAHLRTSHGSAKTSGSGWKQTWRSASAAIKESTRTLWWSPMNCMYANYISSK